MQGWVLECIMQGWVSGWGFINHSVIACARSSASAAMRARAAGLRSCMQGWVSGWSVIYHSTIALRSLIGERFKARPRCCCEAYILQMLKAI